jgi:hypothetical protein
MEFPDDILNSNGDKASPCFSPQWTEKASYKCLSICMSHMHILINKYNVLLNTVVIVVIIIIIIIIQGLSLLVCSDYLFSKT